jgi:hypothetical protein
MSFPSLLLRLNVAKIEMQNAKKKWKILNRKAKGIFLMKIDVEKLQGHLYRSLAMQTEHWII